MKSDSTREWEHFPYDADVARMVDGQGNYGFDADAARAELRALADRLTEKSKQAVTCEVAVGDAAEAIVSFAARLAVDLIAIGHVGHGRVGDLVLGSVAKRVIDTAPCPVLVVRPTHNEYARRAEI